MTLLVFINAILCFGCQREKGGVKVGGRNEQRLARRGEDGERRRKNVKEKEEREEEEEDKMDMEIEVREKKRRREKRGSECRKHSRNKNRGKTEGRLKFGGKGVRGGRQREKRE